MAMPANNPPQTDAPAQAQVQVPHVWSHCPLCGRRIFSHGHCNHLARHETEGLVKRRVSRYYPLPMPYEWYYTAQGLQQRDSLALALAGDPWKLEVSSDLDALIIRGPDKTRVYVPARSRSRVRAADPGQMPVAVASQAVLILNRDHAGESGESVVRAALAEAKHSLEVVYVS